VKSKEYYDKFLRKPEEGVCPNCQDETLFLSLGRGYSKYCTQECMLNGFEEVKQGKLEKQQDSISQGVECKICGMKYEKLQSLGAHIHHTHKMKTKDYYDQYMKKDPKEGFCLECGNPTYFQDLGAGYVNKYCSMACNKAEAKRQRLKNEQVEREARKHEWITCKICGQKVMGFKGLSNHVNQKHATSAQQYYDAYLRKPDEGICKNCGELTRFESLNKGYFDYCKIQCCNQSEKFRAMMSKVSSRIPGRLKGKPSPLKGTKLSEEHVKNLRLGAIAYAKKRCEELGVVFTTQGINEARFINKLQEICKYKIIPQYFVTGRFLDGYIEELKLNIEFDESYHDSLTQKQLDQKREENIRKEIPEIKFFRVSEKDWDQNQDSIMAQFLFLLP